MQLFLIEEPTAISQKPITKNKVFHHFESVQGGTEI